MTNCTSCEVVLDTKELADAMRRYERRKAAALELEKYFAFQSTHTMLTSQAGSVI